MTRLTPFDLAHFQYRVVRDAINEATPAYWLRRAKAFEAARPRFAEYHGAGEVPQIYQRMGEQTARLDAKAAACRARASLCDLTEYETDLLLRMISDCVTQHRQQVAA